MKSLGTRAAGARLERMKASPLWAGDRFQNIHPILPNLRDSSVPMPSLRDFLWGGERRVPTGNLPTMAPGTVWAKTPQTGLRITWLGHSTMLIEIDGVRVLTDPVWGPRASPSVLVGPKRFQPVPVALRDMPEVDVVIISHDHYDHLDYPTIRALAKTNVPFVTSLGVGAHLEYWGVAPERITELDWWEAHALPVGGVVLTAAPSQHFSGRGLKDRNASLWSSFAIRSPRHSVFFSGDTGLTTEYRAIRERLGPFDVTMLEIGAFHPAWGDIHLGPDNAVQAHTMLGGLFMPVHWGTFSLAMHAWDQPAERLLELVPRTGARRRPQAVVARRRQHICKNHDGPNPEVRLAGVCAMAFGLTTVGAASCLSCSHCSILSNDGASWKPGAVQCSPPRDFGTWHGPNWGMGRYLSMDALLNPAKQEAAA